MVDWAMVGIGCLGGLVPDLIRVAKNRHETELPGYIKSANFWIGLVILVALGGFAAWAASAADWKAALACGYGAPEVISRIVSTDSIKMDAGSSAIRRWWSF